MTIVFIGGAGRSGSTLLEKILGNLDGCFSAGELRFIWQYVGEGGHSPATPGRHAPAAVNR